MRGDNSSTVTANLHGERLQHERQLAAQSRFREATTAAIKFIVAGNAGGAIAILSFIGAAKPPNGIPNLEYVALLAFGFGLVSAGIAIFGQWLESGYALKNDYLTAQTLVSPFSNQAIQFVVASSSPAACTSFILLAIGLMLGIIGVPLFEFGRS